MEKEKKVNSLKNKETNSEVLFEISKKVIKHYAYACII